MTINISPMTRRLILVLVVLILIGVGGFAFQMRRLSSTINSDSVQAVFLTNGQVYFGKLENPWARYVRLTDVYYLQMKDGLQSQDLSTVNSGDMALIKLGKELHSPTDKIEINRDQILFIEDLTNDSKVVKAIKDFKGK